MKFLSKNQNKPILLSFNGNFLLLFLLGTPLFFLSFPHHSYAKNSPSSIADKNIAKNVKYGLTENKFGENQQNSKNSLANLNKEKTEQALHNQRLEPENLAIIATQSTKISPDFLATTSKSHCDESDMQNSQSSEANCIKKYDEQGSAKNSEEMVAEGKDNNQLPGADSKQSEPFKSPPNKLKPYKFYGGIDFQHSSIHYDGSNPTLDDGSVAYELSQKLFPSEVLNPNFFLGFDNNRSFKIELNYGSGSATKTNSFTGLGANSKGEVGQYSGRYPYKYNTKNTVDFSYLIIDFKPYVKLDEVTNFFVLMGIGRYDFTLKEQQSYQINSVEKVNSNTSSLSKIAPSFGFGLEFRFFEPFFTRAQVRYTSLNSKAPGSKLIGEVTIKNIISSNIGIGYRF